MALQSPMCVRFKDGNPAAWGRRFGGEESQPDPEVSTEHVGVDWSATLWDAGKKISSLEKS